jgi:hypothetical protein
MGKDAVVELRRPEQGRDLLTGMLGEGVKSDFFWKMRERDASGSAGAVRSA